MDWRLKRQLKIIVTIFIVAALIAVWFSFKAYFTPTCFDNRQNGGEADVDCGGSCVSCEVKHAKDVAIFWTRGVAVRENSYDAVAYVENQNEAVSSPRLKYEFVLSDDKGEIARRKGESYIFPQERTYIIENAIEVSRPPSQVDFRVLQDEWAYASKPPPDLVVEKKEYGVQGDGALQNSVVRASIFNREPFGFREAEVIFVVFDNAGAVLGVSKVLAEEVRSGESHEVKALWPYKFSGNVGTIYARARANIFNPLNIEKP